MTASPLQQLLHQCRERAANQRDQGTAFENLTAQYLLHDPVQRSQYKSVLLYAEWARRRGEIGADTGIDLVAELAEPVDGEDAYCAIQCKFYGPGHVMRRGDIDSFFTASSKTYFSRRLIIETTEQNWSGNAEAALQNQNPPVTRIGLAELENSSIDWGIWLNEKRIELRRKKKPRPNQLDAVAAVEKGLTEADRGKMLMACGTGKTYTSLLIAEKLAGPGARVLFLVPSLALMSQTLTEWVSDAKKDSLRCFAVCSDAQVGKRKAEDDLDIQAYDLAYPATTDAAKLAESIALSSADKMVVVFSTYHSIQVIGDAQKHHGLADFNLIICDEAHRTTGVNLSEQEKTHFTKVHYQEEVRGDKRIYMTATPRIFGDEAKSKAGDASVELCSMDDIDLYGEVLFERGFSWAVKEKLLSDYKVVVLVIDEAEVSATVQKRLADENSQLKLDDATKIIGCYKALTGQGFHDSETVSEVKPVRRALAFCNTIKNSKLLRDEFTSVIDEYRESVAQRGTDAEQAHLAQPWQCAIRHVDGSFGAHARTHELNWLKADAEDKCRILTNVRCLSEGVDVPALDAILFLHPRNSQVDVVQSVGRVMRIAQGKELGYVILPVVIPAGMDAEQALDQNEPYRVVWQILNALRAHDEELDADINRIELGEISSKIEVIAVSYQLPSTGKEKQPNPKIGDGNGPGDGGGTDLPSPKLPGNGQLSLSFDEVTRAIMAKIVKKCGTRTYWENWAGDIARIAQTHIARITSLVEDPDSEAGTSFSAFLTELRDDLNEAVTQDDAIEMLAQHLITRPVFDALFTDYSFAAANPVSKSMQCVLDTLQEHNLQKEADTLEKFYASIKRRVVGTSSDEARQKIIIELYDRFFRDAFPRTTEKLGIVYTPVELVDFIIQSANEILRDEFGQTLGSPGVHILDPFAGTGTFITRLLQSGLIAEQELPRKYAHEIHANEIILLAYYIAAINIETAYHKQIGGEYQPFPGITLCDSFDLFERDDMVRDLFPENSDRRIRLKNLQDIRVILGNPPYSSGQNSANDNAANVAYAGLDGRIATTYAKHSKAVLVESLYDSYIRAIRWGSERIGEAGVMGFVTNAGWLDGNAMDGMRKCLAEEFSCLYIFHLRGNQRTQGELSRREGGKIFGVGSRAPIAITMFVKNPEAKEHGQIYFHDIGDNLKREEKLARITTFKSIGGITAQNGWTRITPDKHHDWLNQRDDSFYQFIPLGDKKDKTTAIFPNYSHGIKTNRDAWCYNAAQGEVASNMRRMVAFYNEEVERYRNSDKSVAVKDFIDPDSRKISWSDNFRKDVAKGKQHLYDETRIVPSTYRPFTRSLLYYSRKFNERVSQMPCIFPHTAAQNRVIAVTGVGGRAGFSALMVDSIPNLHMVDSGQCFPLHLYETADRGGDLLGDRQDDRLRIQDGITDAGLAHFRAAWPGQDISKEDIFYYIYGILHSPDYRRRYENNLSKQLPRIPCVKNFTDFQAFRDAGRELGELHIQYETAEPYPVEIDGGKLLMSTFTDADYRVTKMKFARKGDNSTVIYNHNITITGIPTEAWDYVVNGKPALSWIMERQGIRTDKTSGIVNDANRYATETVGDAAYPLKLFQRIITVSLRTMAITRALPPLNLP